MKKLILTLIFTVALFLQSSAQVKVETRIGELEFTHAFEHGYPTDEAVKKIYDEMDFQRACQAYLWGLPFVSIAEWQKEHEEVFGTDDGDFVIFTTYKDKLGILTANATTPYVFALANLVRTGPLVLELQPGLNAGGISMPDVEGYFMVRMPSQNFGLGLRALNPDNEKGLAWIRSLKLYPYAERNNPPGTKFIDADNRDWSHVQPRGMAYWERLSDIINNEVVQDHDRVMMAMLKPLGIEKGKPFNPDERQIRSYGKSQYF
jgi:hypothetical protein